MALEQRPFFTFEARGYGSLRSQGRPVESLCEATTASTRGSIQSYAIPLLNDRRFSNPRACADRHGGDDGRGEQQDLQRNRLVVEQCRERDRVG